MKKYTTISISLLALCLVFSCKEKQDASKIVTPVADNTEVITTPKFENKGQEVVYNMLQKVGDYQLLRSKHDVVYTNTYQTPDGKTDRSVEKYIFEGELSYGAYQQHERAYPKMEGLIEQGYDGNEYWLKHEGKILDDEKSLKRVVFGRPTNFYWFCMLQKLMDPGLTYEYLGEKNMEDKMYDVVKISFDFKTDKPTDIYQIYVNKKTSLVDQFLFTVADFGRMDPLLMQVTYEKVDGIMIPTKRKYKASTWEADVNDEPWVSVQWSDIKFNNNLSKKDFMK